MTNIVIMIELLEHQISPTNHHAIHIKTPINKIIENLIPHTNPLKQNDKNTFRKKPLKIIGVNKITFNRTL